MCRDLPVAVAEVEQSLEPWSLGGAQVTVLITAGHKLMAALQKLVVGGKVKMRGT